MKKPSRAAKELESIAIQIELIKNRHSGRKWTEWTTKITAEVPAGSAASIPTQFSLAEAPAVLFQDAAVHHHEDAGFAGFFGAGLVHYTFLHPDGLDAQLDSLVYNFRNKV